MKKQDYIQRKFDDLSKDNPNRIMFSPYCRIQQKNKKANYTLIAFSSVNTTKDSFRLTGAFRNFTGNVIYVNALNDWYVRGIPGLGNSYEESSIALKELVKIVSGDNSEIITVGGSMGGYGAVLYGSLLNAKFSLVSGVEFILKLFRGRSSGIPQVVSDIEIEHIIQKSSCQHHVFTGSDDPVDMLNYSYFEKCNNLHWYIIENKTHEVIKYIHEKYTLLALIYQLINNDKLVLEEEVYIPKDKNIYIQNYTSKVLNDVMQVMLKNNMTEEDILFILNTLNRIRRDDLIVEFIKRIDNINSSMYFIIGQAYYRLNNYQYAEQYLQLSLGVNKNSLQIEMAKKFLNNINQKNQEKPSSLKQYLNTFFD